MKLKKIITVILSVAFSLVILSGNTSSETIAKAALVNVNLIDNGNFDRSLKGWGGYIGDGAAGKISREDGAIKAQVDNSGALSYSMQLYKDGFKMYKNGKYHLEFEISSNVNRKVEYLTQLNGGDYRCYSYGIVDTNKDVQKVSQDFVMTEENDMAPRLVFNIGNLTGENLEPHSIKIDNVKLVLVDDTGVEGPEEKLKVEQNIVLNQIGYKAEDKKKVVFKTDIKDSKFRVRSVKTKEVVYEGNIYGHMYNEAAEEINSFGDFSLVKVPGTYFIETDSLGSSYEFTIGEDIYKDSFKDLTRFYYLQRCGQELPEKYAGAWAHPECHTGLGRIYGTDEKIDVSGGWHDAGDFGRYVVDNSKAVADLLLAYSDNKSAFGDNSNIPESGNGVPDILDEVRYSLEWVLKMQDQASGGVYHKVTCAEFPSYVMPQQETNELIVCPISTTATADFAANMAMAYENYKDIDLKFAEKCLIAGEKAWSYLEKAPSGSFTNPPGILTGEFGDTDDSDERYWAAAELFKATGNIKYDEAFKAMARKEIKTGFEWINVGDYGNLAYISAKGADENLVGNIRNSILNEAQSIVALAKNDGYNVSIGTNYNWGSNATIANNAMLLAKAYRISPNEEYLDYAEEHINYFFGKNSLGKSYITGHGSDYPENPHHLPSVTLGKTIPGMVVGGPDKYMDDWTAKVSFIDEAPARCYLDNFESYSVNEVCITWNSPLICSMSELNMD